MGRNLTSYCVAGLGVLLPALAVAIVLFHVRAGDRENVTVNRKKRVPPLPANLTYR